MNLYNKNMSYEQTLKVVDDILRTDAGCATPIDYIEQTSWILFLKYLSDLEKERIDEATLKGKEYKPLFSDEFTWDTWAVPKKADGTQDIVNALTGDDLLEFVNVKLIPYLKTFKTDAENSNTLEYKIGEVFSEIGNKLQSGYTLRDVLNNVDSLRFLSIEEKHEMSHLYEEKIKDMGNAGRSGGEYYTPRPLIQTIVEKVNPKIGDTVYDPAVGSAGFLVEAFKHMSKDKLSVEDVETLQFKTFYGKEKKSLAYIIAIMNMILHGVDAPNILHINTLTENILDVQDAERHDVILANPPFGGKERKEVQQNFPIKSGETAYLFMQHFIKLLKAGGRAGVVIKNTFLSNTDNASVSLRKELLETCNLHTILDLPGGAFPGAGVKTVVLFFDKGSPTKKIQYYQLNLDRNIGKGQPLNLEDLDEFRNLTKDSKSENIWTLDIKNINEVTYNLGAVNPNIEEQVLPEPTDILKDIEQLEIESSKLLKEIKKIL
jgi:type I restriction enzyme M protein